MLLVDIHCTIYYKCRYFKLLKLLNYMVGMTGFEPTNIAVKVLCLTAWRHPNIYKNKKRSPLERTSIYYYSIKYYNQLKHRYSYNL